MSAAEPLRVLTVHQPWASLIAVGAKRFETRGWWTRHRGPVAIHAAALSSTPRWALDFAEHHPLAAGALAGGGLNAASLPFGAVVAVARIAEVLLVDDPRLRAPNCPQLEREVQFGDFSAGRFAWLLADVVRLRSPVAASGTQRLWFAPDDVAAAVRTQLSERQR